MRNSLLLPKKKSRDFVPLLKTRILLVNMKFEGNVALFVSFSKSHHTC